MACSSRVRPSTTSRISLHKINVNIPLLQKYERPCFATAVTLLYSFCTQTRPHKLQHQRSRLHANDTCWSWVIDLIGKCLKLWYIMPYVSYNDLHKCKEATNLHKILENCIHWLRNERICMQLEHGRVTIKYIHVQYTV